MEIIGKLIYVLIFIDIIMFFTGNNSFIGWIMDKLGL